MGFVLGLLQVYADHSQRVASCPVTVGISAAFQPVGCYGTVICVRMMKNNAPYQDRQTRQARPCSGRKVLLS
jgi:hypothetical protein